MSIFTSKHRGNSYGLGILGRSNPLGLGVLPRTHSAWQSIQEAINARFAELGVGRRIGTDGVRGPETWNAMTFLLGFGWWDNDNATQLRVYVRSATPALLDFPEPDDVRAIQTTAGLSADGGLGRDTWNRLDALFPNGAWRAERFLDVKTAVLAGGLLPGELAREAAEAEAQVAAGAETERPVIVQARARKPAASKEVAREQARMDDAVAKITGEKKAPAKKEPARKEPAVVTEEPAVVIYKPPGEVTPAVVEPEPGSSFYASLLTGKNLGIAAAVGVAFWYFFGRKKGGRRRNPCGHRRRRYTRRRR